MKTRGWQIENGGWWARSVVECGGPPALSRSRVLRRPTENARGLAHSKTWRLRLASFCLLLPALSFRAWGQYSIDWHTIDSGGGTSTGGVYSVSGSIGQPDAGAISGGNFTLQGGFWGLVSAVQMPGAPHLWVARTLTNARNCHFTEPLRAGIRFYRLRN